MSTLVGAITLTIDGRQISAEPGQTVLDAARQAGIQIPTLCHNPDLPPGGQCRLCLVEIKGFRGFTTSCTTRAAEGMEVRTESPELERVRRITLELLLADHPQDCLTCGQNLNCELQRLAAELGVDKIRFSKTTRSLALDESNPFFVYDPNKCVLCGRCVQTCRELQGAEAIDFTERGYSTVIGTSGLVPLADSACESCGECVVRCPTGALSRRERRQPTKFTKTVCSYCGVGCSLILGTRGSKVVSVDGEAASPVNRGRLCVKGRFGQTFINSPDRLTRPLIKKNGTFVEASWDEALDLVASRFREYDGDQFAAISSSRCTNEENYLVQKFARVVMQTNNVDNCARLCHAPTVTGLSRAFGTGGGTNPLADVAGAACLFVIGSNTTSAHPVAGAIVRAAARRVPMILADPRKVALVKDAALWLPLRMGTDVALLMGMARVILDEGLHDPEFIAQRCDHFDEFREALADFDLESVERITGVPRQKIVRAARLYATHKPALIMYSLGITEHSHGTDNVLALANLALLTGNVGKPSAGIMPMRGQNNVQGACDMGAVPGSFPGYQPVARPEIRARFEQRYGCSLPEKPGLYEVEFFQQALTGKIKALYCVGSDPAFTIADATKVQEALEAMEFVVFQDIFLTGSAQYADVVLPGTSFAEKDGTFTNLERRVQRIRKAIEPIGEARPDWLITCQIAERMGAQGFDYTDPSQVLDEIGEMTPSFAGISFERLENGSIQWPCSGPDHEGTPRLHVEKFNTPSGKGNFTPLAYIPPAEHADEEYPFILTTGRHLYHYHLAMTSRVPGLVALYPEEEIWINPSDAGKLGVGSGDRVKVASRRGEVVVRARVTDQVAPGVNYMTFHYYDTPTNVLTQQALDPAAKTPEYKVTAIRIEKADGATEVAAG
jgi:formate dehydrogenase alpha subunit